MNHQFSQNGETIEIETDQGKISGNLKLVQNSRGIIIFAHGSGSSRFSPRNIFVANLLQENNLSTLLFDLLTTKEEEKDNITAEYRFNIQLLSERLCLTTKWITDNKKTKIGYFGASTGAAAALIASTKIKTKVSAIVSRGGRPDLAEEFLKKVCSPTLFVVGEKDLDVLKLNQKAYSILNCKKQITIIPGASHLFEEPDKLEKVAHISAEWFLENL